MSTILFKVLGHSVIDVIRAVKLVVLGYDVGLYPYVSIKASHAKLFENVSKGILGSIGRGLRELEKQGLLIRVSSSNSRAISYKLANCPGRCETDGTLCSKYETMDCPIMRLRALLLLLEEGSKFKNTGITHLVSERVRSEVM